MSDEDVPKPGPDAALPIEERLPELLAALRRRPNAVLVAPPGAGKTTRVPLALLDEPWAEGRRILLLEPRRLAARAAAERMALTLGEEVGASVGLRMRLGSRISRKTRIEVVTEGVFTRLILDDPALEGVAAVIFDEFHERSLDADFGLALALDAQSGLREDLRLLVMSATLDGAAVASLLGDAPLIASEGRAFPIETRYLGRDPSERLDEAVCRAVLRALREAAGGILVFLPGQSEIMRVKTRLEQHLGTGSEAIDLRPLHGGLEPAEQDRAIRPSPAGRRKVVLSTSIAETSLTLADIRIVIDCGLARLPVYEPDIGITRLETVRVSRAAADQRRGRAGRVAPGIAYRLWEEAATLSLPAYAAPEILNADLSGLLLDCAAWGLADPARLSFLDAPPSGSLIEARKLLADLQALDADGRLTEEGRAIRALPLPPRLARMAIDAARLGGAKTTVSIAASSIAAVIVERGLGGTSADLVERLEQFGRERSPRAQAMRSLAAAWAKAARAAAGEAGPDPAASPSPGLLVALAYPDRIAKARGKNGEYLLANGRAAALDPADRLARAPYLAVAEIAGRAAASRIRLAAPIEVAEIETWFGPRIEERDSLVFDKAARAVRRRRRRRLGAILLEDAPLPAIADEEAALSLAQGIAALGIDKLPWTKELRFWQGRVLFLRKAEGDRSRDDLSSDDLWPDISDAALAAGVDDWLAPRLLGKTSLAEITAEDLRQALEALLPFALRRRLDKEAPALFAAPSGSLLPIAYGEEGASLAVRVQELFGLSEHPRIAGGRAPLVLHLLSPAQRPIQITTDLPGFWRGSWSEVRAEMRGRYPKHPWPEDPLAAPATSRAKPRGT
ncbi:ATP-dependent helicase HrpB [Rhizobiales bacterium GAS188]|nr:ATP-dependent helicase HrpB [Rhizobiales bacterium GAS188]